MWELLRRYKTDHVQSNLPEQTNDNASPDLRIWKLGPLTLDPQAWHRFRYALGHQHQVAMGTPSHVSLQRRAIIIAIFRGSGTNCMIPSDWDLALNCVLWFSFLSRRFFQSCYE